MARAIQINPFERPKVVEFDLKDSYEFIRKATGVDKNDATFAVNGLPAVASMLMPVETACGSA